MPAYNVKGKPSLVYRKGGAFMQALFIFLVIFFGVFGAAVFLRIAFNAATEMLARKGKERENGRK